MAKHDKRLIVAVAAAIVVGIAAISGSEYFTRGSSTYVEVSDNVRVVEDRKPPGQCAINAAYARGALNNLQSALTDIANDNTEEARKGVGAARSLLVKIKPESSHVLIHSEVRVLGETDPVGSVQAKLDSIRRDHSMSDHDAIIAALDMLNVPLTYTRVDLPLTETVTLVDEVLQALDSQDAGRARTKLLEVGRALKIETVQLGTKESQWRDHVDLEQEDG